MLGSHNEDVYDVVVVGAGAAGVGIAVTLMHAGIENFVVLDRRGVGSSFASWPTETRLITPSFATNSIGMLDLNSIAIGTSPAYSLEVEHPTGQDYARYLRGVARFFEVPVRDDVDVVQVGATDDGFRIHTVDEVMETRHVIWAAGEFQYPQLGGFEGSQLCRHTATVPSYDALDGDDFIIVGGYESGIDAACHLAYRDKRVRVFDLACPWERRARTRASRSLRLRTSACASNRSLSRSSCIQTRQSSQSHASMDAMWWRLRTGFGTTATRNRCWLVGLRAAIT